MGNYRVTAPPQAQYGNRGAFGVQDSLDASVSAPGMLGGALNMYPSRGADDGAWLGRPGFFRAGTLQLGTGGVRRVQWVGEFLKNDGTRFRCAVVAGRLWSYDWEANTWADVSGLESLDTAADVYVCVFANRLVLSDGVNKPVAWDGSGPLGWEELTNAPVAYGQPVVYVYKLFFVHASNHNTISWSEEGEANLGYESTVDGLTYNNAWQLAQTDAEGIERLVPTEEALLVFRRRSITAIYGRTTDEFTSDATRASISDTVGLGGPGAIVHRERDIWFLDADMRPNVYEPGAGVKAVDDGCQGALTLLDANQVGKARGVLDSRTGMVLLGAVKRGALTPTDLLVFDPDRPAYCGTWSGFPFTAIGEFTDPEGQPRVVHATANGNVYIHGDLLSGPWSDAAQFEDGGARAVKHVVTGSYLGYSVAVEKRFLRCDLSLRAATPMTAVRFQYRTPRGQSAPVVFSVDTGLARFDIAQFDSAADRWAGVTSESARSIGLAAQGRWCQPELVHERDGEQFGFMAWSLTAALLTDQSRRP